MSFEDFVREHLEEETLTMSEFLIDLVKEDTEAREYFVTLFDEFNELYPTEE